MNGSTAETEKPGVKDARFTHLLVALALIYVVNPLAEAVLLPGFPTAERVVNIVLLVALLIAAVRVSSTRPAVRRAAGVVAAIALVLQFLFEAGNPVWVLVLSQAGLEFVLLLATVTIGTALVRAKRANGDTIRATICFYLLAAIQWAFVYSIVALVDPGAFSLSADLAEAGGSFNAVTRNTSFAYYFSIVTMTTLGYGDISPVSEIARALAGAQAVFGQFYLAIVVARLVSLHAAGERR